MRTQLPQRAPADHPAAAAPVRFQTTNERFAPADVSTDMRDLATRVRSFQALQQGQNFRLPLGGRLFDVVVTASCAEAHTVVRLLDEVQHVPGERADACGPVIEDPERRWLIWLVPPGTSDTWAPHRYGTCLGRPHEVALPAIAQAEPPGPYWLRPCRGDRLVPPAPLRAFLDRFQPGPAPHEEVLGTILSAIF